MQRNDFPLPSIKHRASRTTGLGRGAIMDARYALDLRIAPGRPLMIKQFVVLKREREIAPARMANDVNSCTVLHDRQSAGQRHWIYAHHGFLQPQHSSAITGNRR